MQIIQLLNKYVSRAPRAIWCYVSHTQTIYVASSKHKKNKIANKFCKIARVVLSSIWEALAHIKTCTAARSPISALVYKIQGRDGQEGFKHGDIKCKIVIFSTFATLLNQTNHNEFLPSRAHAE